MEPKNVNILVWDTVENFKRPETQRQFGNGNLYKHVYNFQTENEFKAILDNLDDNEYLVVCCHVNYEDLSGYFDFVYTRIIQNYNLPKIIFLSSGPSGEVMKKIYEKSHASEAVILYSELVRGIQSNEITPISKLEILNKEKRIENINLVRYEFPQIKYAIITALFEYEFEEIKHFIDFPEEEIIETEKIEYHIGYLKSKKEIQVVAGIPRATGMVDSAILATLMLEKFRPQFLLMSGVCGAIPKLSFGDIVVGKQFFVFQKGKISDLPSIKDEFGQVQKGIYDAKKNLIDLENLYDYDGKSVGVNIELFEVDHDSIIELDHLISSKIERKKEWIANEINKEIAAFGKQISIEIEPIACSTMVINQPNYFEDRIKPINRKTVAVEMESYGIARACQFGNNGITKAVIFKSVMDNMKDKDDNSKRFAANTSARFLTLLLTEVIASK